MSDTSNASYPSVSAASPPPPPPHVRVTNDDSNADNSNDIYNQAKIIKVGIYDTTQFTILQAFPWTKAAEFCDAIASKIDLTPNDIQYYTLILVHTRTYDSPSKKYHCVCTLRLDDNIIDVLTNVAKKQAHKFKDDGSANVYCTWYYKDIRTSPLRISETGDLSGNSSTESEHDLPLSDLSYLRQGERRGYLLKRSSKDPNLWRKRYCMVSDNFWCVDARRKDSPRARSIILTPSMSILDHSPSLDYPLCFVLHDNAGTHFFRAPTQLEHQIWIDEVRSRIILARDSEAIKMADIIIGDEEVAKAIRLQRGMSPIVTSCIRSMLKSMIDKYTLEIDQDSTMNYQCINSSSGNRNSSNRNSGSIRMHRKKLNARSSIYHKETQALLQCTLQNKCHTACNSDNSNDNSNNSSSSIVSILHSRNNAIATAIRFIKAVHRYKELFRHDLSTTALHQWQNSCSIYQQFLSSKLDVFKRQHTDTTTDTTGTGTGNDLWNLSMAALTIVHETVYSNVRRDATNATAAANGGHIHNTSNRTGIARRASNNNNFWSRTFTFTASTAEDEVFNSTDSANDNITKQNEYIILDSKVYTLIDDTIHPPMLLFDSLVSDIEQKLYMTDYHDKATNGISDTSSSSSSTCVSGISITN